MREDSPLSFSFQLQNKVIRISETSIDPAWIKRGEVPANIKKYNSLVLSLDLSADVA